jgi:hypothetical protein
VHGRADTQQQERADRRREMYTITSVHKKAVHAQQELLKAALKDCVRLCVVSFNVSSVHD